MTNARSRCQQWFVAMVAFACSLTVSSSTFADDSQQITVVPAEVHIYANGWTQQLLITGQNGNGRDVDLTRSTRFTSSDDDIATVSSTGLIRSGKSGTATITVQIDDLETAVTIHVAEAVQAPGMTFANDVVPILTKLGCNSGGCHGKATGQNGFKLSLLGFEPEFDYDALVHEARGRRVFAGDPDHSLLLAKGANRTPHGGGARLQPGSDDYRVMRDWIRQGAPGPRADDPVLEQIVVTPQKRVLAGGDTQQIVVTARFSDGNERDVTRQAVFDSNVPELATADATGLVTTHPESGLFAVMVRFGGKIGVFRGVLPVKSSGVVALQKPEQPLSEIDRHLFTQWEQLGIVPSEEVDDATFIRRVTLDICGTLPTAEEVNAYLTDQTPEKKRRLIDRLLERPEYASYFALKWADILQNRGQGYSTSQQRSGTTLFASWIRDSLAENKPYDRFVSEILTATGSQSRNPATLWYRHVRTTRDYVESLSQAFLGVRIQCAQCHHHPAERWSQADYYSLAAVFSRVGRKGGFADAEVPTSETIYLKSQGEILHPRTGEVMRPRPLGGPDFETSPFQDPRRALAQWMTAPDNPYFARTMANRMWGHFLGRGIIHPIDDARSTNPPSNPELLSELSRQFADGGYDVKQLIRSITLSAAYARSAVPNDSNRTDRQSFARFYPRRLSAEVLLDGISQVLEVPTQFPGGPGQFPVGTRAIDLPDENVPLTFLDVFGRPARSSACECERTDDPALAQALELVNSTEIQRKLTAPEGYIANLAANELSHDANIRSIFLRVFARQPSNDELATAEEFLKAEPDRAEGYRSLVWTLLATNEFLFNR